MQVGGSVALVTGASSGIGREVALRLARAGAHVLAHGRDEAALAELTGRIDATPLVADLAEDGAGQRLAEAALAAAGRVDILVSNAGIGWAGPFAEMPPEVADRLLRVNLAAPIALTRALLPQMLAETQTATQAQTQAGTGTQAQTRAGTQAVSEKRAETGAETQTGTRAETGAETQTGTGTGTGVGRQGYLMFVTSIAGRMGVGGEAVYAASKAGLDTFAESLRFELAGRSIDVGVLVPGVVDTAFFDRRGRPYDRGRPRPIAAGPVADTVVRMIAAGRAERYAPGWLRLPVAVRGTLPGVYRRLGARFGGGAH